MRTIRAALERPPSDRAIVVIAVGACLGFGAGLPFAAAGMLTPSLAAAIAIALMSLVAGVASAATWASHRRAEGLERRVRGLLAAGAAAWALGGLPYLIFLASGGDPFQPAAWSQVGFLAAYPSWFWALWLLRQSPLGHSRLARAESWAIELTALAMIALVVGRVLWLDRLPASENLALLMPVVIDLLLLATLYNAVRRSSVRVPSVLSLAAGGFGVMALTDAWVTYLVPRGQVAVIGLALLGYVLALALLTAGASRPMRVTRARAALRESTTVTAAVGLGLAGFASFGLPGPWRALVWAAGAFLLWRLLARIRTHQQEETDALTGLLGLSAFSRHLGGVLAAARPEQPAVLIGVRLDDFTAWNARHGFAAGDALLQEVAARLESSALPVGLWARMRGDGFAWIGVPWDPRLARGLAEAAEAAASANGAGVAARAGLVTLPADATRAADALAAVEESLAAAQASGRRMVAFDSGVLDGIDLPAGYGASQALRRQAMLAIVDDPGAIISYLQPVVSLESGETIGFEALSRFRALPARGPDRWIAEAHAVGLGHEIEVACIRSAVARRHEAPAGAWLSVNVSAETLVAPETEAAFGAGPLDWLVLELTEHEAVSDYSRLRARLEGYRRRGARVAVDDAGAGHSSLRHVAQLRPEYVKLDGSLVRDLHRGGANTALLRSMMSLEGDLGLQLIAEGVETMEELAALGRIGICLAQGHLFARPEERFRAAIVPAMASGAAAPA